jgi:HlyD family secretion protein
MRIRETIVICLLAAGHAAGQPKMEVVLVEAEVRLVPNTTTLVSTVEPLRRSVVGSEMAGIVSDMRVRQGDFVQAGSLLVKLNDDTLRFELVQAEAMLGSAQADLRRVEFDIKRIDRLYDESQAGEKEVYESLAARDKAMFAVAQQQALVDRLRIDNTKTELRAPFSGYIVRLETELGQWIDRGGAVVELADLSSVLVRVNVPEFALPYTHEGTECSVFFDALKRSLVGRVRHIVRQADVEARTFPVDVEVRNDETLLAGGMFARATVPTGPEATSVAVPKDAIIERDGVKYVGLVFPGQRGTTGVLTPVTTGADIGDWVAVTSKNIRPGTNVVVRGNEMMMPFPSTVIVVDERGNPVASAAPAPGSGHTGPGSGSGHAAPTPATASSP